MVHDHLTLAVTTREDGKDNFPDETVRCCHIVIEFQKVTFVTRDFSNNESFTFPFIQNCAYIHFT